MHDRQSWMIGADDLTHIFIWIDSAYTVNHGMRSQTSGAMSMGVGVLNVNGNKKKLNVKRSTEAKLVDTSEYIPYNL